MIPWVWYHQRHQWERLYSKIFAINNLHGITSCQKILEKGEEGLSKTYLTRLKYHAVLAKKKRYRELICMLSVMRVAMGGYQQQFTTRLPKIQGPLTAEARLVKKRLTTLRTELIAAHMTANVVDNVKTGY